MTNFFFIFCISILTIIFSDTSYGGETLPSNDDEECVVLLHGLARSKFSMQSLESYLQKKGYKTINRGYASTEKTIEEIAAEDVTQSVKACNANGIKKVHFVTHSLGGIVVRQYLQTHAVPAGSRMVMLGPPNKGSELADEMKELAAYRWLNGPAGQELGTDLKSTPNRLQPVDIEIGIIAGDSSMNPLYSSMIPGPDDGKVAVEKTKLEEMKDFIVLPYSHSFIMNRGEVMRQVAAFLKEGRFDHSEEKEIKPFTSDGCSLFPDGTMENVKLWCGCCLEHDIAYWQGGTEEERKTADEGLRKCVEKKTGNAVLAEMMYNGVRVGGSAVFPTWYRWGYGWPYGRGSRPTSESEKESIEEQLEKYRERGNTYVCEEEK